MPENDSMLPDDRPGGIHKRLTTYLYWAFWVGVAFFAVYPATNWLSNQRHDLLHLYISAELTIPFMPQFIWLYLSMYVLFMAPPVLLNVDELSRLGKQLIAATMIAGVIFLLFPAELGFERTLPDMSLYKPLFAVIFNIDHPYNLVPSLHVVFSTCILLAISDRARGWYYGLLMLWLVAIMASTLLVHQHHLLDIMAGLGLTVMLRKYYRRIT